MHDAYQDSSIDEDKPTKLSEAGEDTTQFDTNADTDNDANNNLESSRLYERLGNFDVRTNNMKPDLYMKFSDVRKGSFLPRTGRNANSNEPTRKRGRPPKGKTTWKDMQPSSMVFLHWLGFDPMSSLPPPDEGTTQALGFLAHDFLGKIVEKVLLQS